jgi:hybrid cluster-associated redox disulfide protein
MVKALRKRNNRRNARRTTSPHITTDTRVADVMTHVTGAERVLAAYGIHCTHCNIGGLETLEEGCRLHGFDDAKIDELITDLNALLRNTPCRPQTITVTAAAAVALRGVMETEHRKDHHLIVTTDGAGGFCMEFEEAVPPGTSAFAHASHPDVRVFAPPLTLRRSGGATIDFRKGRFKLDLPEL